MTYLAARHGVGLALAAKPRPDRVYELPTGEEFAYTPAVRRGTEEGDLRDLRRWLGFEASFQSRSGAVAFRDQR